MPIASIVVPIFNSEKYLTKCIDSLINQTLVDIEIILVDDGSTDSSGSICDRYSEIDKRIRVLHKTNEGVSVARNIGISLSRGQYIGFVDSDDWVEHDMFEMLYDTCSETNSNVSICSYYKVYNKYAFFTHKYNYNHIVFNNSTIIELLMKRKISPSLWGKLFDKTLFENIHCPEGRVMEDTAVIHEILFKASKIAYIDCPKYYYTQNDNGIMEQKMSIAKMRDYLYAYKMGIDFCKNNIKPLTKYAILQYLYACRYCFYSFNAKTSEEKKYKRLLIKQSRRYYKKLSPKILADADYSQRIKLFVFNNLILRNLNSILFAEKKKLFRIIRNKFYKIRKMYIYIN